MRSEDSIIVRDYLYTQIGSRPDGGRPNGGIDPVERWELHTRDGRYLFVVKSTDGDEVERTSRWGPLGWAETLSVWCSQTGVTPGEVYAAMRTS